MGRHVRDPALGDGSVGVWNGCGRGGECYRGGILDDDVAGLGDLMGILFFPSEVLDAVVVVVIVVVAEGGGFGGWLSRLS